MQQDVVVCQLFRFKSRKENCEQSIINAYKLCFDETLLIILNYEIC